MVRKNITDEGDFGQRNSIREAGELMAAAGHTFLTASLEGGVFTESFFEACELEERDEHKEA